MASRASFLAAHYTLFKRLLIAGGLAFLVICVTLLNGRCFYTLAYIVAISVTYPLKILPGKKVGRRERRRHACRCLPCMDGQGLTAMRFPAPS